MALVMKVFGPGDQFGQTIPCESSKRHKAFGEFGDPTATLKPGEKAVLRDGEEQLASYNG